MRLLSIRLHPFAGIEDQRYDFKDGQNVLQGPNEAGKSTVFQAVMHGLLTTTFLTKTKIESVMGSYFPAVGGDVIRVDMDITDEKGKIVGIQKIWKKGTRNGRASLKLTDGTEITDGEDVQKRIDALLPVSSATLRTIMFGNQSGLHRTIKNMERTDKVRKELGDLLRKNLMETGGVSVDRFKELLNQKYEDYFNRWDREQQYPNNNRGIKNPYKVGTGLIVDAFYKMEQFRVDLDETLQFEDELDAVNEQLTKIINQEEEKEKIFGRLNPLKEGIRQRQLKEQKLEVQKEKRGRLLEVSKKWPVYENKIESLEPALETKQEELEKLRQEQAQAQNKQKAEQLKTRIGKIGQLSDNVEDAQKEIDGAKQVEQNDLEALRKLQSQIKQFQAKIEAAKLTVKIESETDRALLYAEAGQDEQKLQTGSDKSLDKIAEGGFTLQTDCLKIKVFSGEGDLEQTIDHLKTIKSELSDYLENLEVETIQDADSFGQLLQKKRNDLDQAQKAYQNELDEQDLEELKEQLDAFGDLSEVRSTEDISDDIGETKAAIKQIEREDQEAKSKIEEWTEKYGSSDKVILELGDTSKSVKDLNSDLEELPSLPEGYKSSEEFIREVDQLAQAIGELKDKIYEKKQERTGLEAKIPDTSSEELQKLLEDAELEFERIKSQAETLARVREKAFDLIKSLDSETYKGLEISFIKWMEMMLGQRFSTIDMDDDMPSAFKAKDAAALPFDLLSHGTKDTVALAWRFALCEKFFSEATGFVILDDPMVDIDPERRKDVVKAINGFSRQFQTIVLTCHPEHAEELGGEPEIVDI